MSTTRELIINADDFGMSAEVNAAILQAFERGLVSSTSLMANMPGFDAACEMVHRHALQGRIGLHFNLTEGRALTEEMANCARLCRRDATFRGGRLGWHWNAAEKRALACELQAQFDACRQHDVQLNHIDSHHHSHTQWNVGTVLLEFARQNGLTVRLSNNCGTGIPVTRQLYKMLFNARLRRSGLARSSFFGSAQQVAARLAGLHGRVEAMVHPRFSPDGELVDRTGESLQSAVERLRAAAATGTSAEIMEKVSQVERRAL